MFTKNNLPALVDGEPGKDAPTAGDAGHVGAARPDPMLQAHLLGQNGQKRGLRGGQPVLDAARSAYLDAEWRGDGDRRLPPGTLRRVIL